MHLIVDNNSGFPVTQDLLTTEAEAEKYKAEHCEDVDCVVVSESNYNEGFFHRRWPMTGTRRL